MASNFRRHLTLTGFLALSSLLTPYALGQSYQGGIRGAVNDASGAAVASAKVTLTDQNTSVTRATLTNATGEYVFNAVPPATYRIDVENPGFKKFERTNVIVNTQEFLTVDVKMELGAVSESVMVTEEVPLMETSNASTGQVIDHQKLVDLPNLGRNPFMMSKIAQNTTPVGNPSYNRMQDQSGSSSISIAGGPVRGNNYLLDGVPITDSVNRAIIIPTIETVEEVKIQANTYDAEMGRTGGGVFNTYMKSGTNMLHGTAFGAFRESDWLANSFFNNRAGIANLDQPFKNFGGSLGGPVIVPKVYNGKNKTFWEIGFEGYRQISVQPGDFAVPTLAERSGDFSKTLAKNGGLQVIYDPATTRPNGSGGYLRDPFPGNIIPANRLDTVGKNIAATYPLPTRTAAFYGDTNYTAVGKLFDRAAQETGKLDHQVTSWWRVSVSYLHYGSVEPGANYFNTVSSPEQWLLKRNVDATQVNSLFTPNPTTVISVRYGYNRFPNVGGERSDGFNLASLGFSPAYAAAVQKPTFPNVTMQALGNSDFRNLGTNNEFYQGYNSKNFLVSASKFIGRHSWKAGFDYRRINLPGVDYGNNSGAFTFDDTFTRSNPTSATTGTGADLASLLLGAPTFAEGRVATKLFEYVDYFAGYLHDDIRVSQKLTLNLGLRYEWETGLQEQNNRLIVGFDQTVKSPIPVTLAGATAPLGGLQYAGTNGYGTTASNPSKKFSPRVGMAYQLDSKTTLRGGYGIFWAPIPWSVFSTLGYTQTTPGVGNNNLITPEGTLSNPFPGGLLPVVGNSNGLLSGIGQSVNAIDQSASSPIIHQYSFDVQRQLPGGITLSAGFVGSTGRHLILGTGDININQVPSSALSLGNSLNDRVTNPFYVAGGPGFIGSTTITRAQSLKPFPQFANVTLSYSDKNQSQYEAFVLKAQKRFTNGLTFVTTWTHSRLMDGSFGGVGNFFNNNGALQDAYNIAAEYSRSVFDTPDRWVTGFTYELPVGRGKMLLHDNKVLDFLVGGWSVNGISTFQTGFPLAFKQNSNLNSILGTAGQRPNATGVSPDTSGALGDRLGAYLNPAAFSLAPAYTFGNVSRTSPNRGPGQANWDLSLFKTFSVAEKLKAQFRAEAINALNTPIFRGPNTSVGSSSFGQITSQANYPRYIQLGARFMF